MRNRIRYGIYLKGKEEPFLLFLSKEKAEAFVDKNPRWEIKELKGKRR